MSMSEMCPQVLKGPKETPIFFLRSVSIALPLHLLLSLRHMHTHQLKLKRLKLACKHLQSNGRVYGPFFMSHAAWATINPHLGWGGELQHSAAFRFRSSEFVTDTGLKVPCRVRGMDTGCSVMMLNAALLVPNTPQPFNISLVDYRLTL